MIAFPEMLIPAALESGMKVPEDADNFDKKDYPHFKVFCNIQLGRPMHSWTEHWENAKVIASISEEEIKTLDLMGLIAKGIHITT